MRNLFVVTLLCLSVSVSAQKIDSCAFYRHKCDTLNHKLYIATSQLTKVKFYLAICRKKPSQRTFLYSWINRTIK